MALRLAVERPELVGRLVLGSPLVRPSKGALRMQRLAMRLVPESKLVDAGVSRPRMLAVLDALKGFDGTESLRQVTAPVLLLAGGRDKAGIAAAQQLAGLLRDSEVAVIEGAGAVLNTDAPRELADLTTPSSTRTASVAATPTVAPARERERQSGVRCVAPRRPLCDIDAHQRSGRWIRRY